MHTPLRRFALSLSLLPLLLAASGTAQAQVIGRVLIAVGEVSASRGGQAINLGTGSAVENGDTIRVGPASNAQIRFNDEGIVALRPQTVFRIDEYNYAGRQDGAEKIAFNLIQGGMRTITGLIGKLNRNNYLVRTPTSTVGIRGTNYNLVQCDASCVNRDGSRPPAGTYGGVYDGSIGVSNQSGDKTFGAEEFFYVAGPAVAPQALIAPPSFLQDRLEGTSRRPNQRSSEAAETTAQSGASADGRAQPATTTTVPTTPVYVSTEQKTATGASAFFGSVRGFIAQYFNGIALKVIEDCPDVTCGGPALQARSFAFSGNSLLSYSGSGFSGNLGGGAVVDAGSVNIAGVNFGWGRWTGGFSVTDSNGTFNGTTAKSGVFFAFTDDPTTNHSGQPMPTSGAVSYVLAGGPSPVDTAGTVGSLTSMSGTINFATRAVTFNMGLNITTDLGLASITGVSGGGTLPANNDSLSAASLSGSCAGAGCNGGAVSGNFDARFATGSKAMVVNGALTNAVQYTGPTNKSVLFLNVLKCSTC